MSKCPACRATWVVPASNNSDDSELEDKLDELVNKAIDLGRCYFDAPSEYGGNEGTKEQQYHAAQMVEVKALKEVVHQYIGDEYEKDD